MEQKGSARDDERKVLKFAAGLSDEERLIFLRWIESLPQLESEQEPSSGSGVSLRNASAISFMYGSCRSAAASSSDGPLLCPCGPGDSRWRRWK